MNRLVRILAWLTRAKLTHGSLVIVTDRQGRYLLVQEGLRERNRWGFPGGFMNTRERPAEAAVRELLEEAGVTARESQLIRVAEYKQPWAWHYDHVFAITIDARDIGRHRRVEIQKVAWCKPDELPDQLTRAASYALTHRRAFVSVISTTQQT